MNYGLYLASSGVSVNLARQDVVANNLANVGTVGFKEHIFATREREAVRIEDGLAFEDSDRLLERLGAGAMTVPTRISLKPGALELTEQPLDVAIDGAGFLMTRVGPGADGLRLTRDGSMSLGPDGQLVRSTDGSPLLAPNGTPITLDPAAPVHIRSDGSIEQNGAVAGRLWIADVRDPRVLVNEGAGLLRIAEGEGGRRQLSAGAGQIVQGALEQSSVDPIRALMNVTNAGRATQNNLRMVSLINDNLDAVINRFGRVG